MHAHARPTRFGHARACLGLPSALTSVPGVFASPFVLLFSLLAGSSFLSVLSSSEPLLPLPLACASSASFFGAGPGVFLAVGSRVQVLR